MARARRETVGLAGKSVGWYQDGEPAGFIASVVGAMALLGIYRLITKGRSRHHHT
ncbi:MAG TPA: GlsB/YeaQ/YmgE family stress response membrane protein [Prosthecobacter sp.]|nr:GlsB/YeaQ/YmgE family stress response membrane protein [Prosthecobacter sp.]